MVTEALVVEMVLIGDTIQAIKLVVMESQGLELEMFFLMTWSNQQTTSVVEMNMSNLMKEKQIQTFNVV